MTYKDIILLLSNGYSRSEIEAMQDDPQPQPEPQPQPQPEPQPQPLQPDQDPLARISAELAQLRALVQAGNRISAQAPANIVKPTYSAESVLAEMANI